MGGGRSLLETCACVSSATAPDVAKVAAESIAAAPRFGLLAVKSCAVGCCASLAEGVTEGRDWVGTLEGNAVDRGRDDEEAFSVCTAVAVAVVVAAAVVVATAAEEEEADKGAEVAAPEDAGAAGTAKEGDETPNDGVPFVEGVDDERVAPADLGRPMGRI